MKTNLKNIVSNSRIKSCLGKKTVLAFALAVLNIGASAQWNDQTSGISNDLNSVYFLDGNNGWAVGRQGKILHTTNGGSTWTQQNSGTTNDLNKVFMANGSTGFAVGKSGTCLKYNGSSWSQLNTGFSLALHGVHFLDASTGWISGDWGRIMMTTNGGTSWTTQVNNSMYSNLFYDIHMLSSSEGWAVGTGGRVLRYNGTNWLNFSNPASADLYSVHFSSSSNGFMTGKNSSVYYFDGSSWSQHNTALPDNSFHVYCVFTVNNSLAYAATTPGFGGAGIILKYDGSFWNKDYEYTGMFTELFYGLHINSSGSGYAVGAGGMIKVNFSAAGGSGINNNNVSNSIRIKSYPNPVESEFNIECEGYGKDAEIRLSDVSRKILNEQKLPLDFNNKQAIRFDASGLSPGVYFVNLKGENISESIKIIKTE